MLDRNDPRVRRVPFMTGRPTFNETRRVVGRLATLNLNVVEEPKHPTPEVDDDLASLADTKFVIAARPAGTPAVPEPILEPEIVVPEPELHAAARTGDAARVYSMIVDESADPTETFKGKVAYHVSKDKETRDAFRRAMAKLPEAWDWIHGAAVPSALTDELEAKQAAKEAEYEAARKAKEKERKKTQKERKKKESASAALLAKTAPPEPSAIGEKKSATLLDAADREARERREQMVRTETHRRRNSYHSYSRSIDSSNHVLFTNAGSRSRTTIRTSKEPGCRRARWGELSRHDFDWRWDDWQLA